MKRAFLSAALLALFCACQWQSAVQQPIQFSHKAHTEKGLPCVLCHQSVETAASAGMPGTNECMLCHRGAITQNPEEEKVRQFADKGAEIPWSRVYQVRSHVFFSHRRHVTIGGVQCAACHGEVANSDTPLTKATVTLNMDTCVDCHNQRQASTDCDACHR